MALIKCSECGKDISEKAKKCPHCGVKPKKKTKNKLTHILKIIIAIILLIAIIVTIIVVIIKQNQKFKLYNNTVELGQEDTIKELTNEDNIYIKNGYSVTLKNNNIDINNLGTYEATFELKGEGNITEIIKKIKVVDTTPPTVKLNKDTVYVGDEINLEELITITDFSQEEALTFEEAKVKVGGKLNTSEEGTLNIVLTATDKNGNIRNQPIKLEVKNSIISVYDYITNNIKKSGYYIYTVKNLENDHFSVDYTTDDTDMKVNGTFDFTEMTLKEYSEIDAFKVVDIINFNNNLEITKIFRTSSLFGTVTNEYVNVNSNDAKGTIDIIQGQFEDILGNLLKNNISIVGKTVNQLKSETIDLRTLE